MTVTMHDPMDAVSALMDERARYEGWLSTLETRRASTPQHVYDRVRADYQTRLKGVLDQLAGRATQLQERADGLKVRVAELQREEDAHRDERAEAELRAAVGEHSDEQWSEIRARADGEITRLNNERSEVNAELEKVRHVLSVATPPRSEPAIPAAPAGPPPEPPARRGPPEPLVRPAEPASRGDARDGGGSAFDELAFLKSVVGPRGSDSNSAAPSNGAVASPGTPPSSPAVPAADRGARGSRDTDSPAFGSPAASSSRSRTDPVPAFLKDVPSEQVKTLKCQECGTMNYPTEWYCERCGGELAAM